MGSLVLLFVFILFSGTAMAQQKLTMAYTTISPNYSPIWIAKDFGIFEKNGVSADVVFIRGATPAAQALMGGSVQFVYGGGAATITAALSGADFVILAVPSNRIGQVLVTKKKLQSPRELKGAKMAVISLTGTDMLAARVILNAIGLNPDKDITFLALGSSSSSLQALRSGLVEATVLTPPLTLQARKAGYYLYEDIRVLKDVEYISASLIARWDFVRKESPVVEKVVRSIVEAVHLYTTNKPATLRILKKYLRLQDPEELEEAFSRFLNQSSEKPYPTIKAVKTILDWSSHPNARTADPAKFIEPRFVEKLDKEGFIDALYKK
ncbi:MAG: ABC transporter substrate-binding protein [Deltaproteobacteria bacterium]|nr:ABC transporter substrate-binding protein [Deltaproteobacteria bacterium]